jgi:hypothetical protein
MRPTPIIADTLFTFITLACSIHPITADIALASSQLTCSPHHSYLHTAPVRTNGIQPPLLHSWHTAILHHSWHAPNSTPSLLVCSQNPITAGIQSHFITTDLQPILIIVGMQPKPHHSWHTVPLYYNRPAAHSNHSWHASQTPSQLAYSPTLSLLTCSPFQP